MSKIIMLCVALMVCAVAGCKRAASTPAVVPAPQPSPELVDEIARDEGRLKELRRLCVEERQKVDEALCAASALAARKRFIADPKPRYMPLPMLPKHLPP